MKPTKQFDQSKTHINLFCISPLRERITNSVKQDDKVFIFRCRSRLHVLQWLNENLGDVICIRYIKEGGEWHYHSIVEDLCRLDDWWEKIQGGSNVKD
jgi:hypothetical protein